MPFGRHQTSSGSGSGAAPMSIGNFATPGKTGSGAASGAAAAATSAATAIPRHLQPLWLQQGLSEELLLLQILHLYFSLHLPIQEEIDVLCRQLEVEVRF